MMNQDTSPTPPQSQQPEMQSLETAAPISPPQTPAPASANVHPNPLNLPPQKKPFKKRRAFAIASLLILTLILGLSAWRLYTSSKKNMVDSNVLDTYQTARLQALGVVKSEANPLNNQRVSINGDLVLNEGIALSPDAVNSISNSLTNKVTLNTVGISPIQAGNIAISGTVLASVFQGNGSNLSNLNASALTSGTVSNDRLDPTITRLGQVIPISALSTGVLTTINGVAGNTGNIDIEASGGLTVTNDTANNKIILTSTTSGGDISGVIAGTGLLGGGLNGDVTLNVDTGIVTVQGNTFNGVSQLVKLDGSGALPVLSGNNLSNLNASNISSGTLNDSRLSSNVTAQGNTFNGSDNLVKLNGAGELPVLSAINLTNLNATNIVAGSLDDARLSSNVTLQGNTFNAANKLVKLDGSGNLPALNGSALTNLNASNLGTGTVGDARLSANVALLGANQTFSGNVIFSQPLTVNAIQPSASMIIGATNQSLTLQGDLTTKLTASSGGNKVTLGFNGTPTGNVIYNLDAATTPGTYTLCTTVGNCASSGGGVTTLGGTTNKLTKFTGTQSVGDSSISDTGTLVTIAANGLFKAGADSTTAFRVQQAATSNNVFTVDTTNTRVAIGQNTASYPLDVAGDINSTTGLRVGGNLVCDSTGCAAGSGSGFYIQNATSLQAGANINIESTNTSSPTVVLKAKTSQTADLLTAKDSSNAIITQIDANGNINTTGQYKVGGTQISSANLSNNANLAKLDGAQTFTNVNTFKNSTDSTSAFKIQNAAGSSTILAADTSNNRIAIGQASAGYTLDVNGDVNIAGGSSYRINGVAICGPTATCAPSSGSDSYVQNGLTLQTANFNIQSAQASGIVGIVQGAVGQTADLLQARNSSNAVLAKITSTGAIYQGANQVCDTSNNCGYATTSGSGNYIQNGTSTQTANSNIQSADAGQVTSVIQGASSQTADIFQSKDGSGLTVASIGATGNALFKATSSSSTAFRIQDAAGNSLLTANTNIPASNTWNSTTSLTANRAWAGTVDYNGYIYDFGGYNGTSILGDVIYNHPNFDGTLGAWNTTTSLPAAKWFGGAAAYNGYMYVTGGSTTTSASTATNTVWYAPINSDGTLGTWNTTTSLGTARYTHTTAIYNGFIYVMGGKTTSSTQLNDVQYAPINSNGTIGSWNSTSSFATARNQSSSIAYNGYMYMVGGYGSGNLNDVQYAQINPNGTLGSWTTTTSFSTARYSTALVVNNGTMYIAGGTAAGDIATTDVQYATVNPNGTVGTWTAGTPLTTAKSGTGSHLVNGYLYMIGGVTGSSTYTNTSHFTSIGGTTSQIAVDSGFAANSTAVFKNAVNSTTAFQIQNAAGTNLLSVDSTTSIVRIGTGVGSSTYSLFSTDAARIQNVIVGGPDGASTMRGASGSGGTINLQNTASQAFAFTSYANTTASNVFQFNATPNSTAENLLQIQKNGTAVATVNNNGSLNLKNATDSAAAAQVQNSTSTAVTTIGTSNTNLLPNPSFDVDTSGWTQVSSSTIARATNDQYSGAGSQQIITTTTNSGATAAYALAASTTYSFSIYAKATGSNFSTFQIGYTNDGSTFTSCLTGQTVVTTGWTRYSCSFTTSGSVSGTRFVYFRQTDATGRTFFVDAAQLEVSASATSYNPGNISLNGIINSPTTFQNQSNALDAFKINNATGTNLFNVDTTSGAISIGSTGTETGTINVANGTGALTLNLGAGATGSKTINIGTGSVGNTITMGNTNGSTGITINAGNFFSINGGSIYANACNSCLMQIGLNGWQQYISIGNSTGNTSLTTYSGTGGTNINSTGQINLTTGSTYGGTLTFGLGGFTLQASGGAYLATNTTNNNITLGSALTSGSLTLGGASSNTMTGNIDIGIGNGAQALNFGTGAAAKTITIGSTTTNTALNFKVGATATNGITVLTGKTSGTQTLFNFTDGSADNLGSISIDTTANTTTYNTTSDKRLKENIADTHYTLNDLLKISVADYSFITDPTHRTQTGFLAQDLYAIFPDAVKVGGADASADPWAVDYGRLTPLLVKSIQELNTKVDKLGSTVTTQTLSQATWDGGLVSKNTEFAGLVSFDSFVTFKNNVSFVGDVDFAGRVSFADKDMAGIVTMNAGTKTTHITFTRPYAQPPIVTATPKDITGSYAVQSVTTDGFDIVLPANTTAPVAFNWIALLVKQQ